VIALIRLIQRDMAEMKSKSAKYSRARYSFTRVENITERFASVDFLLLLLLFFSSDFTASDGENLSGF
jgi:hypothetical protein